MWGWGYSFSMWQTLQMWQMLSKCILPHFAAHLPYFAADFLLQKPYLCTEFQSALKLQTNNQARIPTKFLSRTQIQRK